MKLHTIAIIATVVAPYLVSSETVLGTNLQECIDPSDYPADTDFFPEKFAPHETTDLLDVTYHKTYKIVTNEYANKSYLLYQCGLEPPAAEVESGRHHLVLPVPHTGGLVVTQTPQIPPLEMLAKRGDINAYVGNPKLVSSPCLNHMMNDEAVRVIYFEDDPWNSTLTDRETDAYLEMVNPDAIVLAGPWGNSDGERRISIAASQEKTAVATFDWLGMYAALFNMEGTANKIIADTESRYDCSADNAKALSADVQREEWPKILWAEYFDSVGGWSVAKCPTWDAAYYCEYAEHCGAEIISQPEGVGFSDEWGYMYLTDEDLLELGKDAETWIYPSRNFEDVYYAKKDVLDQFKSVQNKNVYDTQGQGPDAWLEQRLAEYDVVALDLCSIAGTNNPDAIHRRRWFRSYFDEPIGNLGSCDAPDELEEAYIPAEAKCTLLSEDAASPNETETPPDDESTSTAATRGVEFARALVAGIIVTAIMV